MRYRQTLRRPAKVEGVGLHTGREIRLTLRPAEPGRGVVFRRVDRDEAEIPARLTYLLRGRFATVLGKDGLEVSTVEHLLAALYALQVDDVLVDVDGPEVPILDGSSLPFVEAVLEAGRVEQPEPREFLAVSRPVEVTQEEKRISIHPCHDFRVTYAIEFDHPQLGYQELTARLWRTDEFTSKVAPARTFTFERDVEALRRAGLARGGSLENAVVVGEDKILNEPLRFPDEFVRHKMLDLTGDLSLVGYPILGHVVAYRAGHDLHTRLARRLLEARSCWFLTTWDELAAREGVGERHGGP